MPARLVVAVVLLAAGLTDVAGRVGTGSRAESRALFEVCAIRYATSPGFAA